LIITVFVNLQLVRIVHLSSI